VRTTVNLDDDVADAVIKLRRERGIGVSEAVNELARAGTRQEWTSQTSAMCWTAWMTRIDPEPTQRYLGPLRVSSRELYRSVPTVKQHVSRIITKLDLNNRTQIALLAHDAGLA